MILCRPVLDIRLVDHEWPADTAPIRDVEIGTERARHELLESKHAFKNWCRAGHSVPGKHGGEEAISSGVCKGTAFPHGQFASPCLAQSDSVHSSQSKCMHHLPCVATHQLRGGKRGRE